MTSRDRTERDDQILTVADIAGHIGAHEQTDRGWIASGELKASTFGTRIGYRILRVAADDFLHRRPRTGRQHWAKKTLPRIGHHPGDHPAHRPTTRRPRRERWP